MANISLVVISVLFVVGLASAAPAPAVGSLLDGVAGVYGDVWKGIGGETAEDACKKLGYDTPIKTKGTRGLLDPITKPAAEVLGVGHKLLTSESMAESFCAKQGLRKGVASDKNVQVPNNNGQQIQVPTGNIKWTINHGGTTRPLQGTGHTIVINGKNQYVPSD